MKTIKILNICQPFSVNPSSDQTQSPNISPTDDPTSIFSFETIYCKYIRNCSFLNMFEIIVCKYPRTYDFKKVFEIIVYKHL